MKAYIQLIRPRAFVKNGFVLAPYIFSFHWDIHLLPRVLGAFVVFCLAAGAIYVFNDIHDLEEDKHHPLKKRRPLPANELSVSAARKFFVLLAVVTLLLAWGLGIDFGLIILIYLVLHVGYSLGLKHMMGVDILIVGIGFVLRVWAGAEAAGVRISLWLSILTFLLAGFLVLGKRRMELTLLQNGKKVRKSIDCYNGGLLRFGMYFTGILIIAVYFAYTLWADLPVAGASPKLAWTVIPVLLGIGRFVQLVERDQQSYDPVQMFWRSWFFPVVVFIWIFSFIWIVWSGK